MNRKQWAALLALPVGFAIGMPIAGAATEVPPPPGVADAAAVQVNGVAAVSHTHADAHDASGTDGSSASANVLELGGQQVIGGTAKPSDTKPAKGALLDTHDIAPSLPVRVELTPWEASLDHKEDCTHADGKAAVARVTLVDDKTGKINVLQSESHASNCESNLTSKGSGSTDGATVALGNQQVLDLLHSESAATGKGHTYVVSLGGTEILNNDQVGKSCALAIPSLLDLACLTTGGGTGANLTTVLASVANVSVGGGALSGAAFSTSGASGAGSAGPSLPTATLAERSPAPAAAAGPAGKLAFTGAEIDLLALAAAGLLGLGGALLALERRRGRAS